HQMNHPARKTPSKVRPTPMTWEIFVANGDFCTEAFLTSGVGGLPSAFGLSCFLSFSLSFLSSAIIEPFQQRMPWPPQQSLWVIPGKQNHGLRVLSCAPRPLRVHPSSRAVLRFDAHTSPARLPSATLSLSQELQRRPRRLLLHVDRRHLSSRQ